MVSTVIRLVSTETSHSNSFTYRKDGDLQTEFRAVSAKLVEAQGNIGNWTQLAREVDLKVQQSNEMPQKCK